MTRLRTFLHTHCQVALLLLALVLCARLLVPEGYMPSTGQGFLTVRICHGTEAGQLTRIALPADDDRSAPDDSQGRPVHQACPFGGVATGALEGDVPVWTALLLAFVLLLGFAPVPPITAREPERLRPPAQAPPLLS